MNILAYISAVFLWATTAQAIENDQAIAERYSSAGMIADSDANKSVGLVWDKQKKKKFVLRVGQSLLLSGEKFVLKKLEAKGLLFADDFGNEVLLRKDSFSSESPTPAHREFASTGMEGYSHSAEVWDGRDDTAPAPAPSPFYPPSDTPDFLQRPPANRPIRTAPPPEFWDGQEQEYSDQVSAYFDGYID